MTKKELEAATIRIEGLMRRFEVALSQMEVLLKDDQFQQWITIKEAAARMGTTVQNVYVYIEKGRLERRKVGGVYEVPLDQIAELKAKRNNRNVSLN